MVPWNGLAVASHYCSILDEHRAATEDCALFDLGYRAFFKLEGAASADILNTLATLDLRAMPFNAGGAEGSLWQVPLVDADGKLLDLPQVIRQDETSWLLIFSNPQPQKALEQLRAQIAARGNSVAAACTLTDLSHQYAWSALTGAQAENFLKTYVSFLSCLQPQQVTETLISGVAVLLLKTSENSFEFACQPELLPKIIGEWWAGESHPRLCGWASYENWRLENGLLRHGSELKDGVTPLELGLDALLDLSGGHEFLGRDSLSRAQQQEELQNLLIHFCLEALRLPRRRMPVFCGEKLVGEVCAGGYSPRLRKPIGSAWVRTGEVDFDCLQVEIRRQRYDITIKTPPFN